MTSGQFSARGHFISVGVSVHALAPSRRRLLLELYHTNGAVEATAAKVTYLERRISRSFLASGHATRALSSKLHSGFGPCLVSCAVTT